MVYANKIIVFYKEICVQLYNELNMSGEEVKEKLRQEGIVFSELARLLGYDSDQRLHSALKANDVRSGLIEDIARAINKSVSWFYPETTKTVAMDNGIAVSGNENQITVISEKFISLLEKKDEQINRLLDIIEGFRKDK